MFFSKSCMLDISITGFNIAFTVELKMEQCMVFKNLRKIYFLFYSIFDVLLFSCY